MANTISHAHEREEMLAMAQRLIRGIEDGTIVCFASICANSENDVSIIACCHVEWATTAMRTSLNSLLAITAEHAQAMAERAARGRPH